MPCTDGLDFKLSNTWTLYSDSFHSRTLIMLLLFCTVLIIFIDITGVDEMRVDEKRVDEPSSRRNKSRRTRYTGYINITHEGVL